MKILFLSDDFPPQSFGGAGISTYELALGMRDAGNEVFVVTTCRRKEDAGEFEENGIHIIRLQSNYDNRFRAYLSLWNPLITRKVSIYLDKIRPDVVHANNVHQYLSYHCIKVAKRFSRGVIFTARDAMTVSYGKLATREYLNKGLVTLSLRDNLRQAGKQYNPFRNILIRKYLKRTDRIVAVSNALREVLEGNRIKNVSVVHTGVLPSERDSKSLTNFKLKYGLEGKSVILLSGRISVGKGAEQIFSACSIAFSEIPSAVLVLVGSFDAGVKKIFSSKSYDGIRDKVVLIAWLDREDMELAFHSAYTVLVPSVTFDAFPRSVIEAMAANKPVITSPYGGAKEAVEDGKSGYIIDPMDTALFSCKIRDLLQDSLLAQKMGRYGGEIIRTRLHRDIMVKKYSEMYNELLKKQPN